MFEKACNLSENERIVRMSLGLILLLIGMFWATETLKVVILVLAAAGIVTGIAKYDPLYDLLNVSNSKRTTRQTRRVKSRSRRKGRR